VHLLPCSPPNGSLEPAPRTSLRTDSAQERWEGFWCLADDRYYARCVRADGTEQWHCFADKPAKGRWARNVRGASYVNVRGTSYVSVRGPTFVATQDARRTLTQVARRTLTLDARRTILVGKYGQRALLVRMVRRSRARRPR
jgi:hypothetical protein